MSEKNTVETNIERNDAALWSNNKLQARQAALDGLYLRQLKYKSTKGGAC